MKIKSEPNILESSQDLLNAHEASSWATEYTGRDVSVANIQYLIQYGRIPVTKKMGVPLLDRCDLESYLSSRNHEREQLYKDRLGDDLHWHLSFDQFRESDTTKHVHRLHPYKGKYIPQLVEYFLDSNTDEYKREAYFNSGDIVLDPFCGSGTTLVQANELGLHAIGIDISSFNCAITNAKLRKVSLERLIVMIEKVEDEIKSDEASRSANLLDFEISAKLSELNREHFPKPEFRQRLTNNEVDEHVYSKNHLERFQKWYNEKLGNYFNSVACSRFNTEFLNTWLAPSIQAEVQTALRVIESFGDSAESQVLKIILSRTVRSCRATKHSDLATLIAPVTEPYYCRKHYKICKPLISSLGWWRRYSRDTARRLSEFDSLRTNTMQYCVEGDSTTLDIGNAIGKSDSSFAKMVRNKGFSGIMTSPPYVGIIDYHEQHAYSYELFGLVRKDRSEIGPLSNGSGKDARKSYADGIVQVLTNCRSYMNDSFNVFIVVNDKFNLYPEILARAGLRLEQEFRRPVLNRAEGNKGFYSENIFHCRNI